MSSVIVIIAGDAPWTRQAMHLASAVAIDTHSSIVVLELVLVSPMQYQDDEERLPTIPFRNHLVSSGLVETAREYGVEATLQSYEYHDYVGAVKCAAEQFAAALIFAPPPLSYIPYLAQLRLWWLRHTLSCPLFTLSETDQPDGLAPNVSAAR